MSKKVVWSNQAINELESTLSYWTKRNKSSDYSNKIIRKTDEVVKLIVLNPDIGLNTKFESTRMKLVMDRFYLFYRDQDKILEIVKFWDTRQNPLKNQYL